MKYFKLKNAVRLIISKNRITTFNIITDFKAMVLLKRKNDNNMFLATVKIKAKANFLYNAF